jgi:hypothetical protein
MDADTQANIDTAVWAIEQEYWTSPPGSLGNPLADDALIVTPAGAQTGPQALAAARARPPWARVEMAGRHLAWPTADKAVLSYRVAAWRGDAVPALEAQVTSVRVLREGEWRLAFHQESPAPPGVGWQQRAMLYPASRLTGCKVEGNDGPIGTVADVYFDDERWGVRHLLVRTGDWLDGREVLLSPHQLLDGALGERPLRVTLTREQVRHAPEAATDPPVSRHYEAALARYYRYPAYWNGPMLWGDAIYPGIAPMGVPVELALPQADDPTLDDMRDEELQAARSTHLRSAAEVRGYRVEASDGDAGKLADLMIDERSWSICALVVDAHPWWFGGKAMVSPSAVQAIEWGERELHLRITREALKRAPAPGEHTPGATLEDPG